MRHPNHRIVEAGVRGSGHPGVWQDFQAAREMNPGIIQVVARAAGRRFSPAIHGQRTAARVLATVGVVGTVMASAAIYLIA